jgi:hypothetical protein
MTSFLSGCPSESKFVVCGHLTPASSVPTGPRSSCVPLARDEL